MRVEFPLSEGKREAWQTAIAEMFYNLADPGGVVPADIVDPELIKIWVCRYMGEKAVRSVEGFEKVENDLRIRVDLDLRRVRPDDMKRSPNCELLGDQLTCPVNCTPERCVIFALRFGEGSANSAELELSDHMSQEEE